MENLFSTFRLNVHRTILALESEKVPWINYLFTFIFVLMLRNFVEAFSQPTNNLILSSYSFSTNLIHYTLSYLMLALLFIGFFSYVCKTSLTKVTKVILPAFSFLLITPLVDLLLTKGHGAAIYYLQPGLEINVLNVYLTYFGGGFDGASTGIKIEIMLALFATFIYCRVKQQSVLHSLIYTWMCYTIIFLWAASPYFIHYFLNLIHLNYAYSGLLMTRFYLLGIIVVGLPILYAWDTKTFILLLKDCRFLRVFHYQGMLILGAVLALTRNQLPIDYQLRMHQDIPINLILCEISIFLACFFSIVMNNIADIAIDKISNTNRPLVKAAISLARYKLFAYVALGMALFYAAMVNVQAFFIITVMIAGYYIYSMPPIRFKRVPVFSKIIISLNSLALLLLGYLLIDDQLTYFPYGLFWIYLLGYTCAVNFIDIKDVAGDKAAGIVTLPIILPRKYAHAVIGFAFLATYVSFIYLLPSWNFLPLLFLGGVFQYYLINKKIYREKQILLFYNASIFLLIMMLILFKKTV